MSTICHRHYCRGSERRDRWCGCGGGFHGGVHFNKWFTSHLHYTAELVSRLLMPDAERTVRRILPTSAISSSSASVADDEEVEASSDDSCSSGQQTSQQHDAELEEFQNELRDFIRNLHISSTSDVSVSPVIDVQGGA